MAKARLQASLGANRLLRIIAPGRCSPQRPLSSLTSPSSCLALYKATNVTDHDVRTKVWTSCVWLTVAFHSVPEGRLGSPWRHVCDVKRMSLPLKAAFIALGQGLDPEAEGVRIHRKQSPLKPVFCSQSSVRNVTLSQNIHVCSLESTG